MPVPQWQKDELNRRKQSYLQNPESGQTWDQVKQEILQAS
jgi:putative addiction module component (TIGR02574 family)